ncbi:hypothetical protein EVAR_84420_1 [Eumeta japonica]|uniref:Uncharacterized protein n=1 Tax=Eumeta variegata TaxID=151549 RepID=A0A4C1W357_EUMVA|nr:hypothetical protein EVAR_84420_1 [Eumeta japonica]
MEESGSVDPARYIIRRRFRTAKFRALHCIPRYDDKRRRTTVGVRRPKLNLTIRQCSFEPRSVVSGSARLYCITVWSAAQCISRGGSQATYVPPGDILRRPCRLHAVPAHDFYA